MRIFGFGRKNKIIDLSENYKRSREKPSKFSSSSEGTSNTPASQSQGAFSFLGSLASGSANSSNVQSDNYNSLPENSDDKKRKLARRLLDMTNKIEDLSNQIYQLQQRIEVLEKKSGVNKYD